MKKHVTHIKKIEYTPSNGFRFIKRSTHEFLKTQSRVSIDDISANSIVESDFVGERFICTDNEEVRAILEFYERQKDGGGSHVFLKRDFKDFIEIPKDEYEHELLLFSNVCYLTRGETMFNQPITSNNIVGETTTKQQNGKSSIEEEIDREFAEAQKKLDAMIHNVEIHKIDNYSANAEYYSDINVWSLANDKVLGRGWRSDF